MTASDVVATCALVFTIASFWWLYARAGKLQIVGEPRSYSFAAPTASRQLMLNLPLVFTNSRPLAAVAVNLRLRLDDPGFPSIVTFVATHDAVVPEKATRKMATSIVIQGRETRVICCEFMAEPCDIAEPVNLPVTVEAFVWRRRRRAWQPLLTFPLRLQDDAVKQRDSYLTYDNQV